MRGRIIEGIALGLPKEKKSFSLNMASGLAALMDELILLVTGGTIYAYYVGWGGTNHGLYVMAIIGLSIAVVASLNQAHLYEMNSICSPLGQLHKVLGVLSVNFLIFLTIAFALKLSEDFSRLWVFSWFLSSATFIYLGRSLCHLLLLRLSHAGLLSRKIVILGTGEQAQKFLEQLQSTQEPWINILGFFDDRKDRIAPTFMKYPVLGNLKNLLSYVRENRVDDIIITLPWNADKRIGEIVRKLEELPVHVRLGSDLAGFSKLGSNFSSICGVPMLDMVNKPLDGWRYVAKLAMDKVLGALLLILLAPFMLLIALAIKLESEGPVIFRQKRHGFNNKPFSVFKFRTMYHNRPPEVGMVQATKDDPRTTSIGRILRRTSMDELPQLLNVINGSMSLVGPRPHPIALDDEFSKIISGYFARHRVKPGITGWAQVNGLRGETEIPEKMRARIEHDVYYIENWSILYDIKILIMTIPAILKREAY